MKIIQDDKRGAHAPFPFAVIEDIQRRNKANRASYTQAQLSLATRLHTLATAAHNSKVYAPNYRKSQICVKVAEYKLRDKLSKEYATLDKFCTDNNIECRLTCNNTVAIYTIK